MRTTHRNARRITALLLGVVFLNGQLGCTYYKVKTPPTDSVNAPAIHGMEKNGKYIILHEGNNAWHLSDISFSEDRSEMMGAATELPDEHLYYRQTPSGGPYRYKPKEGDPTYEVHLYVSQSTPTEGGRVRVPLSGIDKIEVYDLAVGTTIASYTVSIVGTAFVVLVLVGVLVALTKSSCPFVYTVEGNAWQFAGEMYGGAISLPLERDDFMPLRGFTPRNNGFQIVVSNELLERQYTDVAELFRVDHPAGSTVLFDKQGDVQTLTHPVAPATARSGARSDCVGLLSSKDEQSYLFDDSSGSSGDLTCLYLTFHRPSGAAAGKLTLRAANSFWLDYIYGQFNENFGTYYPRFADKLDKIPAARQIEWSLNQGIPLAVSLQTRDGWQRVGYFDVMGPLASRDLVMPLDLSKAADGDVHLKLECGFLFWSVDCAAMDFSPNVPTRKVRLAPLSATDETGADVSYFLSSADHERLFQPRVGNKATLTYAAPSPADPFRSTYFLHSRGYYEYIRDYHGAPDASLLKSFREKGAFVRFSKARYQEFTGSGSTFAGALNKGNRLPAAMISN